ncbi:MAG TPA: hypothetical protein VM509_11445 [Planctomycetota bacterium]|nr:hypothetical protein [Planctomycetota bacterium]
MKLSNRKKWGLGVAAVLVLGVIACKSTLNLEADASIAGQHVEVKVTYDGRDVKAEKLPANKRADVKFFDAQGRSIDPGATGVGEGDRVPVPAGASYCEVSGASSASSCTGCAAQGGGGGGGGGMLDSNEPLCAQADAGAKQSLSPNSPGATKWVHVFTLDPDIDSSSVWNNVAASFTLQGNPSASEIHQSIEPMLRGGHGTPVPAGVEVDTFVRMFGEALGGRMFVADVTAGFSSLSMTWNGAPYATLGDGNTRTFPAPNGWQVIEIFVPLGNFNVSPAGGSSNSVDLLWTTSEDSRPNRLTQGFTFS